MRLTLSKTEREASLPLRFAVYIRFHASIGPHPDSARQNRCVARVGFSGVGIFGLPSLFIWQNSNQYPIAANTLSNALAFASEKSRDMCGCSPDVMQRPICAISRL